jgi:ribosomal protein L37AE/L43A
MSRPAFLFKLHESIEKLSGAKKKKYERVALQAWTCGDCLFDIAVVYYSLCPKVWLHLDLS